MIKYIAKRLIMLIPVLLGVSIMVFIVMHLFTSDPAATILGDHATRDQINSLRQELGLNKPLHVQYLNFLNGILHGNLGKSIITKDSISSDIASRFPATIELAVMSILIASVFGITIGIISAVNQNKLGDFIGAGLSLAGVSMPSFWVGLLLIMLFAVELHLLPVSGRIQIGMEPQHITGFYMLDSILTGNAASFIDALKHIILPSITLAAYSSSVISRMTRSTMIEELKKDYIRTAKAKGIFDNAIIIKHAFRNALIPVVTVIGLQLGGLLGGAVLTETIFAWPGLGSYTVDAIMKSDYPAVQGAVMVIASTFVLINLAVDLLYACLDPKIKYA